MKTSEKVLQLLLKKQAFLSGQELADELNVSRTAVWKAIQSLQEEGYQIESKPRIGYRYIEGLKLSEASIRRFLNPELDLDFEIYDTIDNDNDYFAYFQKKLFFQLIKKLMHPLYFK